MESDPDASTEARQSMAAAASFTNFLWNRNVIDVETAHKFDLLLDEFRIDIERQILDRRTKEQS